MNQKKTLIKFFLQALYRHPDHNHFRDGTVGRMFAWGQVFECRSLLSYSTDSFTVKRSAADVMLCVLKGVLEKKTIVSQL